MLKNLQATFSAICCHWHIHALILGRAITGIQMLSVNRKTHKNFHVNVILIADFCVYYSYMTDTQNTDAGNHGQNESPKLIAARERAEQARAKFDAARKSQSNNRMYVAFFGGITALSGLMISSNGNHGMLIVV